MVELYFNQKMSLSAVAKELDTYPKKVERVLKKANYSLRTNKESQKLAIEEGRHVPKSGFTRSKEEKLKISQGMSQSWQDKTPEEIESFREKIKEHWHNRTEEEAESFREASREAIRQASMEGSKLEKALSTALSDAGYVPLVHQKHSIDDRNMHLDILLEKEKIAIEVDGPFHRRQIWKEQDIERVMRADKKKNALLVKRGYRVIRVEQEKQLTKLREHNLIEKTLKLIEELKSNKTKTGVFRIDA